MMAKDEKRIKEALPSLPAVSLKKSVKTGGKVSTDVLLLKFTRFYLYFVYGFSGAVIYSPFIEKFETPGVPPIILNLIGIFIVVSVHKLAKQRLSCQILTATKLALSQFIVRLFFSRILCCFEFHFIRINETNFSFYSKPFPFSSHFCSFLWDDYTVEVHINDYLDIICPHYTHGEVPSHQAERYVLYMVEKEDYDVCKPHSFDQLRWECSRPFAPHVPEKFSEKFQRFTPFTLGKEFRQGESYYYISKPMHHHGADCLKLRVDVVGRKGFSKTSLEKSKADKTDKSLDEENIKFSAVGGVHNPSNRLPADDPAAMEPKVQRSIGSSAAQLVSLSLFFTMIPVLFAPVLH